MVLQFSESSANFRVLHFLLSALMNEWIILMSLYFHLFQGSELIVKYDEHVISNKFKFGVIYQKFGQVIFWLNKYKINYVTYNNGLIFCWKFYIIIFSHKLSHKIQVHHVKFLQKRDGNAILERSIANLYRAPGSIECNFKLTAILSLPCPFQWNFDKEWLVW